LAEVGRTYVCDTHITQRHFMQVEKYEKINYENMYYFLKI